MSEKTAITIESGGAVHLIPLCQTDKKNIGLNPDPGFEDRYPEHLALP
ncbi:MAG: hypothetical protein ACOYM3_09810 [Terrimicrobiaceae bacterium]